MSLTIAAISGVVSAAVKYLLTSKGLDTAAQKATEKIGTMGGEALINVGKNALTKLREALGQRGDAAKKAQKALADVEDDPADVDYQQKLATELDKLAAADGQLRTLLEQLSAEVEKVNGKNDVRMHHQQISGYAQVGAAVAGDVHGGIHLGPMNFGERRTVNMSDGDYAEGSLDKREGAFVEGGTVNGPVAGSNSGTISSSSGQPGSTQPDGTTSKP
ncbi:MAG: hypothetical protein H0X37_13240 [Herpetosiphonaceae bacterium]|nr:hypothetical protein [Herpetosiphonaceae bacterium]